VAPGHARDLAQAPCSQPSRLRSDALRHLMSGIGGKRTFAKLALRVHMTRLQVAEHGKQRGVALAQCATMNA